MTKEHVCRYLELQPDGSYFCGGCQKSYRLAVEPNPAQAPIAKITVQDKWPYPSVLCTLYAPGLPPGEHDVYCEPEAVAPYMREKGAGLDDYHGIGCAKRAGGICNCAASEKSFDDLNREPIGRCDRCGRKVWKAESLGKLDEMTQPNGASCGGRFVAL